MGRRSSPAFFCVALLLLNRGPRMARRRHRHPAIPRGKDQSFRLEETECFLSRGTGGHKNLAKIRTGFFYGFVDFRRLARRRGKPERRSVNHAISLADLSQRTAVGQSGGAGKTESVWRFQRAARGSGKAR